MGKSNKPKRSCVITGFGPFEGMANNPSKLIVESLSASRIILPASDGDGSIAVHPLLLPTSGKESWKLLKKELDSVQPSVLVMIGVAAGRKNVSLERFALNIRDYAVADISGDRPVGELIRKRGPDAYRTRLDLLAVQSQLDKLGHKSDVTNHAGTYVCNELFYKALHYQEKNGTPDVVQFVHIPDLNSMKNSVAQITALTKCITDLVTAVS